VWSASAGFQVDCCGVRQPEVIRPMSRVATGISLGSVRAAWGTALPSPRHPVTLHSALQDRNLSSLLLLGRPPLPKGTLETSFALVRYTWTFSTAARLSENMQHFIHVQAVPG
jgi:hypothetical protein